MGMAGEVKVPRLPAGMHPVARQWYASLKVSGESQFYEPSDWADAVVATMALDEWLTSKDRSAAKLVAWRGMANELHTTEGARRRARMEVERVIAEAEDKPTVMDEYRARLAK